MSDHQPQVNGVIAAERRRIIYNMALDRGSVNVVELAKLLQVTSYTIRRDLDALHKEGKLTRSHGGAVTREMDAIRPAYIETRDSYIQQKSLIGEAALNYLPPVGSIFILGGSTIQQLALRIPKEVRIQVTTNSPSIATHLAANIAGQVTLLGGAVIPESLITDCSIAEDVIERTIWEVSFMGASGFDIKYGITGMDLVLARLQNRISEQSLKTVMLCDSSTFGRVSNVKIGPVTMIDVLITDDGVDLALVEELQDKGVHVVIAGPLSGAESENDIP